MGLSRPGPTATAGSATSPLALGVAVADDRAMQKVYRTRPGTRPTDAEVRRLDLYLRLGAAEAARVEGVSAQAIYLALARLHVRLGVARTTGLVHPLLIEPRDREIRRLRRQVALLDTRLGRLAVIVRPETRRLADGGEHPRDQVRRADRRVARAEGRYGEAIA